MPSSLHSVVYIGTPIRRGERGGAGGKHGDSRGDRGGAEPIGKGAVSTSRFDGLKAQSLPRCSKPRACRRAGGASRKKASRSFSRKGKGRANPPSLPGEVPFRQAQGPELAEGLAAVQVRGEPSRRGAGGGRERRANPQFTRIQSDLPTTVRALAFPLSAALASSRPRACRRGLRSPLSRHLPGFSRIHPPRFRNIYPDLVGSTLPRSLGNTRIHLSGFRFVSIAP